MMNPGELSSLFIQTHHLHYRLAHSRFIAFGLGEGQPRLLRILAEEDGLCQADLARRCSLEPATVTAALARMEKAGLVERSADASDQRVLRICLTPKGRSLNEELKRHFLECEEACFKGFSPEERERLEEYLTRMRENLQQAEQCGKKAEE